jgi:ribulose-phosphate 3-epimerase
MALVMTVEPGLGGQKFMSDMMSKVEFLRERFPLMNIGVDGGVGLSNIDTCLKHGANMIVSGTAITNSPNRREVIESIKQKMQSYFQ